MQFVPILIPAYEPDENLIEVCRRLLDLKLENSPLLLIDDGSGPDYQKIFEACQDLGAKVCIRHERNMGKGRALKDAFSYVLDQYDSAVGCVTADSDGQHATEDILACVQALDNNPNALILGCRDFSGEMVPAKSRFGNNLTRKLLRKFYGIDVTDTQTGLRAIPRTFMKTLLQVHGERFEFETNMLLAANDKNNKIEICEVPIETIYDSRENHKTHFRPFVDSIKIYWMFVRRLFRMKV